MQENIMGTLPVGRLLARVSVPLILSMLGYALYGIADSIFVAQLGTNALTALSLAAPVTTLLTCVAVGFSIGMNTVLSGKLGEKDADGANTAVGNGLFISFICAIGFMLFGLFFTRAYFMFQTDLYEIQSLGIEYTRIICIWSFGLTFQVMLERMLVAAGRSVGSMASLMTGTVLNLILDPVLMFGYLGAPKLGISGAAWATVIAQLAAAAVALVLNLRMNRKIIRFTIKMLIPRSKMIKNICAESYPTIIQQSITPLLTFGMNQLLLAMTAAAPAVYIIYARLQRFALIPVRGIKNAVISILSYNAGAGRSDRVRQTVHISAAAVLWITLIGFMLFRFAPDMLLNLFKPENSVRGIGISALKILSFTIPLSGMTKIICAYFQSLGHSRKILIISVMQLVIQMTLAMIMVNLSNAYTIWWSFVITEAVVFLISFIILKYIKKERK